MNTDDLNFAYKVRHALNEQLDNLPEVSVDRLARARKIAQSRKKADPSVRAFQHALAGSAGQFFNSPISWMGRVSVALPLVALVAGLVGMIQFEQQQRITEIAELDAAVLSDELPLTAYLDNGFNAYLAERVQ